VLADDLMGRKCMKMFQILSSMTLYVPSCGH